MNHVMIDIETLGLKPGCVVMQIGAVPFQLEDATLGSEIDRQAWRAAYTQPPHMFYLNVVDQCNRGAWIEAKTLAWWQDGGRHNLFHSLFVGGSVINNDTQLKGFIDFMNDRNSPEAKLAVWCRGTDYDPPIIEKLLERYDFKAPWHYARKVDVRSYLRAAYGEGKPQRPYYMGTEHDAVVDCYNQIQDVQLAWRKINGR